jgi:hypothetical protein
VSGDPAGIKPWTGSADDKALTVTSAPRLAIAFWRPLFPGPRAI